MERGSEGESGDAGRQATQSARLSEMQSCDGIGIITNAPKLARAVQWAYEFRKFTVYGKDGIGLMNAKRGIETMLHRSGLRFQNAMNRGTHEGQIQAGTIATIWLIGSLEPR